MALSVPEIRLLRWMSVKIKKDRIRNKDIKDNLGIAPIEDKSERKLHKMVRRRI